MKRTEALGAAWATASKVFLVDSRPEPLSADGLEGEVRAWLTDVFGGDPPPFALPPDLVGWVDTHPWQFAGARAEGPGKDLLTFLQGFAPKAEEWLTGS